MTTREVLPAFTETEYSPLKMRQMVAMLERWRQSLEDSLEELTEEVAMAVTEIYSGTEAIGATEHSMTTDTAGPDVDTNAGFYQIWLDLSDMILNDDLQIRVYEKVRSGDTQRIAYETVLSDVQSPPIWVSPTFALTHGWDATLDAIAGTITVNWSIRRVT